MASREFVSFNAETGLEPFLLSVLSSKLSAIVREMNATLMRSARSSLIKNARDFSCGLLSFEHELLSVEDCIPVHIAALDLTTKPITTFFNDIRPGDAFLNNCPYTGGTHHADMTLCVPVFCDGEPMFWTLARAHHADVGAPEPSTYLPNAKTIYEEGIHLPCLRIQRDGKNDEALIRMCRLKNRVPDLWYGDFQAQVGACRIGEKRLQEMVRTYGRDTIKAFIREWLAYGERRMIAEIKGKPAGEWEFESRHDPVPGVIDEEIPVRVKLRIDPERALITVDIRDNVDCMPCGLNLSEATAIAACRTGVFYNLSPDLPHNEGSASRIRVLLREGSMVGKPVYPVGTSMATTNIACRLACAIAACFGEIGAPNGMAEMSYGQTIDSAVISGFDPTRNNRPYVNQLLSGYGGGGAIYGFDGWLLAGSSSDAGQMMLDSIEVLEAMYPILYEERRIAEDSVGWGQWEGAPGCEGTYRPLAGDLIAYWACDGDINAPKGIRGGKPGATSLNLLRNQDGSTTRLPSFGDATINPSQALLYRSNGGGGYGDPLLRDPNHVARSVNRKWVTQKSAEDIYCVALEFDDERLEWTVNDKRTVELRLALSSRPARSA